MTLVGPEARIISEFEQPVALEHAEAVQVPDEVVVDACEDQKKDAELDMRLATSRFNVAVATHNVVEPENRDTTVLVRNIDSAPYAIGDWRPTVKQYASIDPWQAANPALTAATTDLIESTMRVTRELANSHDPDLAYLDGSRAGGGRSQTIVTRVITEADPVMGQWVNGLPKAEYLRAVAHPWADTPTILLDKRTKEFVEVPSSPALLALVGGSGDGRAVREREAWERDAVTERITSDQLTDGILKITSLGTGTGEPAMDSGLAVVQRIVGDAGQLHVTGFDVNKNSLAVATEMAAMKRRQLGNPEAVTFKGQLANLLSADGLASAVADTGAHVYEAVGFAEYVPSDYASNPVERQMREKMKLGGCISAEEFYGTIYENMKPGSVLITGNMRSESPQGDFVTDGLGWPGIIKRGATEYMEIIRKAGIPADAVELFVPDEVNSAAAYNLLAITKL